MNDDLVPWQQFEELVRRLLETRGFTVQRRGLRGEHGFDFWGDVNGEQWAIEVKFYRTARPQFALIEAAAARLVRNGTLAGVSKGMLVVSCALSAELRRTLEEKYPINFTDAADLKFFSFADSSLTEELDALIEVEVDAPKKYQFREPDLNPSGRLAHKAKTTPIEPIGATLCGKLNAIKRGRSEWTVYEAACADILRYLFGKNLSGWRKQQRTDDGLNRFDLVCRVHPTTDFWQFLVDHLNSRYVLFEFKNYVGEVKQGQILTTEKYLLERALRRTAIILTRAGAKKDAVQMMQGAMREHGKLMLIVDDEQLCEMLRMKDRGEDPTDKLFEIADEFLLSLPR